MFKYFNEKDEDKEFTESEVLFCIHLLTKYIILSKTIISQYSVPLQHPITVGRQTGIGRPPKFGIRSCTMDKGVIDRDTDTTEEDVLTTQVGGFSALPNFHFDLQTNVHVLYWPGALFLPKQLLVLDAYCVATRDERKFIVKTKDVLLMGEGSEYKPMFLRLRL